MTAFKAYPRDRKIIHKSGYSIIVPESNKKDEEKMPLFCEVCEIVFSKQDDEKTFKLFKCCSSCADEWAYSNKDKWKNGWRPGDDQIKKLIEKRLFVNSVIVFE